MSLCDPVDCSTPGFPVLHCHPECAQIHDHPVSDTIYLILCCLLSLLLLSVFPSIRVFSNESVLHIRWPKYWSFSFGISPCSEYSGLISFRMDWFDFLEEEKKNLWGACKDNLLIRKEQFAKMFFSITTLWFTLLATAMFG